MVTKIQLIEKKITDLTQSREHNDNLRAEAIERIANDYGKGASDRRAALIEARAIDYQKRSNGIELAIAELATAQADEVALQAKQTAELETRAAAMKADALKVFISVGGLPKDFDAHYQSVLVARTVKEMDEAQKPTKTMANYF